ncbi:MAG: SAF domain-containing protein [Candidatus Gottesmanbacteria bacterium GW2011_GWA2_43_14]|uniref:SAF domain-containing protein n=1 Tax=Candidatus Gottesmanbacteria bacterium GW2011_GWA2_43_14 TaxID=1618443 RepID=A0A0G1DKN3_9BACT|nr:MAG: SAF domain-containing protein [Candidatus Gottesmanbacteria bacterium GW2011_GWA2_43_14]
MYDIILQKLESRKKPIEVIVSGLGFVSFGFISSIRNFKGLKVPLVITRRPAAARSFLEKKGLKAVLENNPDKIKDNSNLGIISLTDDLELINNYENEVVIEMTGTIAYGTKIALKTIKAGKHLVTMNPELQATVGAELHTLASRKKVVVTDIIGDQPGSLARLINQAKVMGFRVLLAGNMKRFLNRHATQSEMQNWADNKGLSVKQTVSFTDGTKQSIEMNLVANYFNMDILEFGMHGPTVETVHDSLNSFHWDKLPREGIVDYVIGKKLFPGVFLIAEHPDKNQKPYLSYLGLGEGPRYVLFEPYHLCHLEVAGSIAKVILTKKEIISNTYPKTRTIAVAKYRLYPGQKLDGIGGDLIYGNIDKDEYAKDFLPVGLTEGAVLKKALHQDQPIKISDVILPQNAATILTGLAESPRGKEKIDYEFPSVKV